jgi:uncharacterized membrane protein YqaE (UPF0057 family)
MHSSTSRAAGPGSSTKVGGRGRPGSRPVATPVQDGSTCWTGPLQHDGDMKRLLLIVLCFFFPFIAVLIHDGLSIKVLWAFLLQLLGHIPGVIYGIYQVTRD